MESDTKSVSAPVAGTEADSRDMRRMGNVQELNVSPPVESIFL
jgi:hypothetical protein